MKITAATCGLLAAAGMAHAGGLDRSGQPIGVLFETGTYAELSYGMVTPSVAGTFVAPVVGALGSGNVAPAYSQVSLSFKTDITPDFALAMVLDQPFGASVAYDDGSPFYPLSGTVAEYRSTGITLLGRYKLNERLSLHGGVRLTTADADVTVASPGGTYTAAYDSDTGTSYVIGAAYEIPDIALRVALTYSSAADMSHDTQLLVGPGTFAPIADTVYSLPQSINLDFQTGIAADTLLFGSVRWVDWTATEINSQFYPGNPLIGYEEDIVSYSVGIGRKFSDSFSGAISVGYEEDQGLLVSDLSPTDGNLSIQLAGTYTIDNIEISGGVRYLMLGDAQSDGLGAQFADNTAVALGLRIGYTF